MNAPFTSPAALRRAFVDGLSAMLDGGGLGPFILVCANAGCDAQIHAATAPRLERLYGELAARFRADLATGRDIKAVEEDLLVFLKLHTVGLENLPPTAHRQAGPWQLQFNLLRAFRPKRIAARTPDGLSAPFDPAAFHFNKPFMQKEAFWSGTLAGREATLYYNKYPFADLHALLVPERERCLPQLLDAPTLAWLWTLAEELAPGLPGIGFGYNGYGAFASVNHLHFQMFHATAPLPVALPGWRHNGGEAPYPAACAAFGEHEATWDFIQSLHIRGTAYNLLVLPGRAFVFPRMRQGTHPQPEWTAGFTWFELAGAFVTASRDAYDSLSDGTLRAALADTAP